MIRALVTPRPAARPQKPAALSFSIPSQDYAVFEALPKPVQEQALHRLAAIAAVKQSGEPILKACRRLCQDRTGRGESGASLHRYFFHYTSSGRVVNGTRYPAGDWRCVVNWVKGRKAAPRAAPEKFTLTDFIRHWRGLSEAKRAAFDASRRPDLEKLGVSPAILFRVWMLQAGGVPFAVALRNMVTWPDCPKAFTALLRSDSVSRSVLTKLRLPAGQLKFNFAVTLSLSGDGGIKLRAFPQLP